MAMSASGKASVRWARRSSADMGMGKALRKATGRRTGPRMESLPGPAGPVSRPSGRLGRPAFDPLEQGDDRALVVGMGIGSVADPFRQTDGGGVVGGDHADGARLSPVLVRP